MLNEMWRILRPGGTAILLENTGHRPRDSHTAESGIGGPV